jgi:hypothetical protein
MTFSTISGKSSQEIIMFCGRISIQKLNISCQYPHFAQTEDIWLKSALEEKSSVLLATGRKD